MSSSYRQPHNAYDVRHGRSSWNVEGEVPDTLPRGWTVYNAQSRAPKAWYNGDALAHQPTHSGYTSTGPPQHPRMFVNQFGRHRPPRRASRELHLGQVGVSPQVSHPHSPHTVDYHAENEQVRDIAHHRSSFGIGSESINMEPSTPTAFSPIPYSIPSPTAVDSSVQASRRPRASEPQNHDYITSWPIVYSSRSNASSYSAELPHHTTAPTGAGLLRAQWRMVCRFILDIILRPLYLNALLHLPSLYHSRLAKVFTDAELCILDFEDMYQHCDKEILDEEFSLRFWCPQDSDSTHTKIARFKRSWEVLVHAMVFEWQVQSILSILLLSAVLAVLQIDEFRQDPFSRTSAILSLIAALIALLHGCILMIRFEMMKTLRQAAIWAQEVRLARTGVLWNVWVFLALPAVWLSWSIIAFMVTVLAYVWRTGAGEKYGPLTHSRAISIRVAISAIFVLGLVYFALTLRTLACFGSHADHKFHDGLAEPKQPTESSASHVWLQSLAPDLISRSSHQDFIEQEPSSDRSPRPSVLAHHTLFPNRSPELVRGPYETLLALQKIAHSDQENTSAASILLNFQPVSSDTQSQMPKQAIFRFALPDSPTIVLTDKGIQSSDWDLFSSDLRRAWEGTLPIPNVPPDKLFSLRETVIRDILRIWNSGYFASRGLEVAASESDDGLVPSCIVVYDTRAASHQPATETGPSAFLPGQTAHTIHGRQPASTNKKPASSPRSSWPLASLASPPQRQPRPQVSAHQRHSDQRHSSPSSFPAARFRDSGRRVLH